jgi:hypothetical protein
MPGAPYYAEAFPPALPGAGGLARVVASAERPRYRVEACEGHRPPPPDVVCDPTA